MKPTDRAPFEALVIVCLLALFALWLGMIVHINSLHRDDPPAPASQLTDTGAELMAGIDIDGEYQP